jgi:hypothetical protein
MMPIRFCGVDSMFVRFVPVAETSLLDECEQQLDRTSRLNIGKKLERSHLKKYGTRQYSIFGNRISQKCRSPNKLYIYYSPIFGIIDKLLENTLQDRNNRPKNLI